MADRYVFAIDGGGIRGVIPAVVLKEIERRLDRPISAVADIIVGTSTGGILAVGLSQVQEGPLRSAAELLQLYLEQGPEIFAGPADRGDGGGRDDSPPRGKAGSVGAIEDDNQVTGLFDRKYPADGLVNVIQEVVGEYTLDDLTTGMLVTSYDLQTRRPRYLGSPSARDGQLVAPQNVSLVDAARATSAAPTFFEPVRAQALNEEATFDLIDGGVFATNPASVALTAARAIFPDDDIHVISFGTGTDQEPLDYDTVKDWGAVGWVRSLISILMDGPADLVSDQLRTFLGDRYWRFDIPLERLDDDTPAPSGAMDDASAENLERLRRTGEALVERENERVQALVDRLSANASEAGRGEFPTS
ncbi:Patatin-like phospholipase/acyl hydrolase [Limimonas halophila]|uniref:Patatin-like phospholipase/acyl hydrolase n=1 Tax=Limimonas halophila TaxID=1082479 RepID=A0A1G7SS09_9PROT|nr:patatin-like phospholipase family protein [Limimonas halophila]SDG25574.1 Patatin-like phospholipase/acyl hydrolase [Limimonas halophila]